MSARIGNTRQSPLLPQTMPMNKDSGLPYAANTSQIDRDGVVKPGNAYVLPRPAHYRTDRSDAAPRSAQGSVERQDCRRRPAGRNDQPRRWMGLEDFAHCIRQGLNVPGVYFWVGGTPQVEFDAALDLLQNSERAGSQPPLVMRFNRPKSRSATAGNFHPGSL